MNRGGGLEDAEDPEQLEDAQGDPSFTYQPVWRFTYFRSAREGSPPPDFCIGGALPIPAAISRDDVVLVTSPTLSPDQLLTTTRSVRRRLDLERPVPRELVLDCIEVATQAPTGGNSQGWHFVVLTDPGPKQAIADLYRRSWEPYSQLPSPPYPDRDLRAVRRQKVRSSAQHLSEVMHQVPVLMIPCIQGRLPEGAATVQQAGLWGSILPAAWSFMLAARARGLGSAWTTLHLAFEREAAEVLNMPYERFTQAGLFPVAYYKGEGFRPAPRIPLDSIVHWEGW